VCKMNNTPNGCKYANDGSKHLNDKCQVCGGLVVETGCYSAPDSRTRFQKFRDWLFPVRCCFVPGVSGEFKDCIHGCAVTKLSWVDRFRVLLTGVVVTNWRTVTENEVGRVVSVATCHVGTARDLVRGGNG